MRKWERLKKLKKKIVWDKSQVPSVKLEGNKLKKFERNLNFEWRMTKLGIGFEEEEKSLREVRCRNETEKRLQGCDGSSQNV